jgi:alpha-L-fucosidase
MTLANNWGYVPNDQFKTAAKIIQSLIEVVAKGGSLLLGIGPKPDGTLPDEAVERMQAIGNWMNKNGAAIYNTRATKNYQDGTTWFTQSKDAATRYALVCLKEGEALPATVSWKTNLPRSKSVIKFLQTGETVKWFRENDSVVVILPKGFVKAKRVLPALAFAFTPAGSTN